jgi:hypothetical protein
MRIVTSARLRAVGILLLEAAGLTLLIAKSINKDDKLRGAVVGFIKKARAL